ncbi:MAG TPA: DUF5663 domain-containing protein [Candidatus Saccharimonadales bacterium]|nr:DUF5663 domain-containing protein [Candidatus Saccharimonadales bacterium]
MIKLDDDLLQELGLAALPAEEKKKLLAHIYETLEMRVGMKLAEQMSDAQLTEFEQFIDRNDEAGALRWLETNFPHYKDVVASEFEALKKEIHQVAPQILASSAQAAGAQQPAAPAMSQQPGTWGAPPLPPPGANPWQQQPQPGYGPPPPMPPQGPPAPPYPSQHNGYGPVQ